MRHNKKIIKTLVACNENYFRYNSIDVHEYVDNQEFLVPKIACGIVLHDSQIKLLKIDMVSCDINMFRKCINALKFCPN